MSEGTQIKVFIAILAAMLFAFFLGLFAGWPSDPDPASAKTVTVEKTVPGPGTTVTKEVTKWKKKPPGTIWIVVCGPEKTIQNKGEKPTTECKLPDTGGQERRTRVW